jgi:hypothetical protein
LQSQAKLNERTTHTVWKYVYGTVFVRDIEIWGWSFGGKSRTVESKHKIEDN